MKPKQFLILLIIGALAAAAGWVVHIRGQQKLTAGQAGLGQQLYPDFPVNDVRKIRIQSATNEVVLVKSDDVWRVETAHLYYADFKKIADFLKKLPDLKALQVIEIAPPDYGRLALMDPAEEDGGGTQVEFMGDSGTIIGSILLGKNHMKKSAGNSPYGGGGWPDGRYILEPGVGTVALVSETFAAITADNANWIDKTFFKAGKLKRGTLKTGDNVDWTVQRNSESDKLTLTDLQPQEVLDTGKLNGIDSVLGYPNFTTVAAPDTDDAALGMDAPRIYEAETFEGITYTLKIGTRNSEDKYPVRVAFAYAEPPAPEAPEIENESEEDRVAKEAEFVTKAAETREKYDNFDKKFTGWTFLMPTYAVDKLLIDRADLIKPPEPSTTDSGAASQSGGAPGPLGPMTPPTAAGMGMSAPVEGSATITPPPPPADQDGKE